MNVTGAPISRGDLATALLANLRPCFTSPHRALDNDELARYRARDALAGSPVTVDGRSAGEARGIDELGALIVEREGSVQRIIWIMKRCRKNTRR